MWVNLRVAIRKKSLWGQFTHKGEHLSYREVEQILKFGITKGYEHTGEIKDTDIDRILSEMRAQAKSRTSLFDVPPTS